MAPLRGGKPVLLRRPLEAFAVRLRDTALVVRRLPSLNRGEPLVLVRMATIAVLLPLLHKVLPLPTLMKWLDARHGPNVEPERGVRLARGLLSLRIASGRPNCLTQSLLAFNALRRSGHDVVVCFGIAKGNGNVHGHCWLELDGEALAEASDPRPAFRVIYSYPKSDTLERGRGAR